MPSPAEREAARVIADVRTPLPNWLHPAYEFDRALNVVLADMCWSLRRVPFVGIAFDEAGAYFFRCAERTISLAMIEQSKNLRFLDTQGSTE